MHDKESKLSEHEFLFANRTICVAITFQLASFLYGIKLTIRVLGLRECAEFVGYGNEKIIRSCRAFPDLF
jgi:hypothetical protein